MAKQSKPLAPAFAEAVKYVLEKAGDTGQLYRANVHRSVIARIAAKAVAENDGDGADAERVKELTLLIANALVQESSALEHSNFKQSRLQELELIPKGERRALLADIIA